MKNTKALNFIKKLDMPQYKHLKLLLYWPLFGIVFWPMEIFGNGKYHFVHCLLDDKIPFCEYFIIPYYFWFIFLIGMMCYGLFFDVPAFSNYMKFTIITYTVTLAVYAVYPTAQALRPAAFPRDNVFTSVVKFVYNFDTNTNVCPSIHVLGSMAVYFAARKSKYFSSLVWRITFFAAAAVISVSTVFLKQHSVIDIVWAVILGIAAYPFVYKADNSEKKEKQANMEYV